MIRIDSLRSLEARRWFASVVCLLLLLILGASSGFAMTQTDPLASAASRDVVQLKISGPLDQGTLSLVRRGIQTAKAGSKMLLVELDTPGGELELMFLIANQLADANKAGGVQTVAWIHTRAYSAGALIALSCERIYMSSQSMIGAAAVVELAPGGGIQAIEDPVVEAKQSSAVSSAFRAAAESYHRPPALAEAMVDRKAGAKQVRTKAGELRIMTVGEFEDRRNEADAVQFVRTIAERGTLVSLSGSEAVMFGLADGIADSMNDVLSKVGFAGANLVALQRERSEDLANWLAAVHFLLIGLGVIALVAEFKAPGFGFAGAVAIACFALALFGKYLVGLADVPQLVAVGAGLVLLAVELFLIPGAVWPGVIGAVLVFGGLAFAQVGSGFISSPLGREMALDSAFHLMLGIVAALCIGAVISRLLPRTPLVGKMVLAPSPAYAGGVPAAEFVRAPKLGERGISMTPLRPVGKVRLDNHPNEEVEARSSGLVIEAGARVRVVTVEGLRAVVEAETESRA